MSILKLPIKNRNKFKFIFFALLLVASTLLLYRVSEKKELYEKLNKGDFIALPEHLSLVGVKEESVGIEKGHYYYLFFLEPSCGSCKQKIPFVNTFLIENPEIQVIGIAPSNFSKREIISFIEKFKVKFPVHIDQHKLFQKFRVSHVPTFFLLIGNKVYINPVKINNSLSLGHARIINSISKINR